MQTTFVSNITQLTTEAVDLLKSLIATPSFSKEEDKTADLIANYLISKNIQIHRQLNNVWAFSTNFQENKPTILLNSHHDTVKPNKSYTLDPFTPTEKDGKLYGLGSNDAGGALVSLIATFLYYNKIQDKPFNLIIAATAEEEISGRNGVELVLPNFGKIDLAIVGEPTQMQLAVAEKGLMVIDCTVKGRAGHAARNEGENAIYKALKDIDWFRNYRFPKVSEMLGDVKMTVTIINAGSQHNVVPDICTFTVDIRPTDVYKNAEILEIVKQNVSCEVQERSIRLNASSIPITHPIVQQGIRLGRTYYASPTTSDQALMPFDSIKIGPGDSARSHTADEYIYLEEVKEGIELYIKLLDGLVL
ncbi:M20 family metallo-hydrolase [Thermoflexibacter ruber]|uniref:Acetylornithine deacetylase n=1 Tax=Thermoflexibacter ruber TaxID=1003 RepID=A0A1I2BZX1_9BACT|nr:acetylornithine deacetylase [Thermoflexibacter ruber]